MNSKPNVLIIQTDQQSLWTLSCYGGTPIDTPNIDRLAGEGALLTNFYTNSAVCTPSRGCFVTGRYPHSNGAFRNDMPLHADEQTFAHVLRDNGYATGYAGKWHLNGSISPGWMTPETSMGFEDCRYMFNSGHFKEAIEEADCPPELTRRIGDDKTYMTDWLADKTVEFLDRAARQPKPFLYMVSIPDPHQPYSVRAPYDTMFRPEDMPVPSTFNEERLPDWAESDEWGRHACFPLAMENRERILKAIKAQYCGQVKCIDDNVGKILASLEENGLYENTIVVFTTDHGEYMGEHGLMSKNNLYESAYRIPFIIRSPNRIAGGTVVEQFLTTVDFQQTLLGLIGVSPSGGEQGRDASPLLTGRTIPWENEAFIHPNDVPRTGLFTPRFELAYVGKGWNREEEFKEHILFDRVNDPEQTRNLFFEPDYRDVVEELTTRLIRHHKEVGTDFSLLPSVLSSYL